MSDASTASGGAIQRPLGDLTYADVSESVLCWLPVNRNTLDALSHACRATRAQIARHHDFGRTTFVCKRGCHIRFTQELDAREATCSLIRHSDQLSSLHALSLNNTSLRADEIAAILSKCLSLRTLHLRDVLADDKVVTAIACLAHLETLELSLDDHESIADFTPLCSCKSLKRLLFRPSYDRGGGLDDPWLAVVASLPCLEELVLENCESISDLAPLRSCKSLKRLSAESSCIGDVGLATIVSLPCLEELSLDHCEFISDFTPLHSCKLLKRLFLRWPCGRGGGLDDRGLAVVASLPCLEELILDNCESISDLAPLRSCKSLKRLSAEYAKLDDRALVAVVSLPCLEELSLNGCSFIIDYTPLRSCESLKRLSLNRSYGGNGLDDRGLAAVVSLPCLEELILDNCKSISDFAPLRSCKSLKRLSAENTKLDDRALVAVVSLPCLEELSLNGCASITDFTPLCSCKSLKRLSLNRPSDGDRLDDRGLAAIVSLPYLEQLSLDWCASITDWTLLRTCKSLKMLSVRCSSIDVRGVAAVATLPSFEKLDVFGCKKITDVTALASRHSLKVPSRPSYRCWLRTGHGYHSAVETPFFKGEE